MIIDDQTLTGRREGKIAFFFAIPPLLKCALPVCKGQSGMSSRESRIEAQRHLKKMLSLFVFCLCKSIHVPKASMVGLPCIERVGRFEHRVISLNRFNFVCDRRHDSIADFVEDEKSVI